MNVLALRAAQFIPEVDPQSVPRIDHQPVECGLYNHGRVVPKNLQVEIQISD